MGRCRIAELSNGLKKTKAAAVVVAADAAVVAAAVVAAVVAVSLQLLPRPQLPRLRLVLLVHPPLLWLLLRLLLPLSLLLQVGEGTRFSFLWR